MSKFILTIDQGTTGTTLTLFTENEIQPIFSVDYDHTQIYPRSGEVEHNPDEIWNNILKGIQTIIDKIPDTKNNISCIGITNQRETITAFDHQGRPLSNAIVWQDKRTGQFCEQKKALNLEKLIHKKTGLTLDPYFSASKIHWLINNNSNVKKALDTNELHFGTIDTYITYKLTQGQSFVTEATNASRTMLYNLQDGCWDEELLQIFTIPKKTLPEIKNSFGVFGKTKGLGILPDGIPITGILGDQQAALFGQGGITPGGLKCTYGTGAFMLLNIGQKITLSTNLLTTVAFQHQGKRSYALEGSCFIAGALIQYLRDNLNFITKSSDCETLANTASNKEISDIYFLPFFTGIGSPMWIPQAKATIMGLTRDTTKAHITRAALESIAFSVHMLFEAFNNEFKSKIKNIKVDGGASANNSLMLMQASTSLVEITRPKNIESTSLGAAYAASCGNGTIDLNSIEKIENIEKKFSPTNEEIKYFSNKYKNWSALIKKIYC